MGQSFCEGLWSTSEFIVKKSISKNISHLVQLHMIKVLVSIFFFQTQNTLWDFYTGLKSFQNVSLKLSYNAFVFSIKMTLKICLRNSYLSFSNIANGHFHY